MKVLQHIKNGATIIACFEKKTKGIALAIWVRNEQAEYIVWDYEDDATYTGAYYSSIINATKEFERRFKRLQGAL